MTQLQQKNVPALRFPEFSGEWEEKRIGQYFDEYNHKSTSLNQHEVLTSSRGGLLKQSDYYGENRLTERNNIGFNIIPPNYITYRSRSDNRRFYFNKNNLDITGIISVYYPVFTINYGENNFFIDILNLKVHYIGKFSVGTSQTVLSFNALKSIKLVLPTPVEQKKIAGFLSVVDKRIEQITRKRALLEQYKKGMMQKLFSQELRFKDNNGNPFPDWEKKRLGDIAEFSKGKGISKSDIDESGILDCIRYGQLYTDYAETIINVKSRTNVLARELVLSEANDIIIPASGETQIDIATASCVLKSGIALGGDLNIIKTKHNGVFLSYYLNSVRKIDIARLSQGISVVHLYATQLKLLQLNLPKLPEQQKIADFLSNLDDKINLIGMELIQAQTFKKGLLQQMFV